MKKQKFQRKLLNHKKNKTWIYKIQQLKIDYNDNYLFFRIKLLFYKHLSPPNFRKRFQIKRMMRLLQQKKKITNRWFNIDRKWSYTKNFQNLNKLFIIEHKYQTTKILTIFERKYKKLKWLVKLENIFWFFEKWLSEVPEMVFFPLLYEFRKRFWYDLVYIFHCYTNRYFKNPWFNKLKKILSFIWRILRYLLIVYILSDFFLFIYNVCFDDHFVTIFSWIK